jgi:very-short-patch-repair endonuclease
VRGKEVPQHDPLIIDRARKLRRDLTFPERLLWHGLRGRRLAGLKFRRQHPIDRFIVDFVCLERRLIIELDGDSHIGQAAYDLHRQAVLEKLGYRVLRVGNDDVLQDLDSVVEGILIACGNSLAPHPGPLPAGEREKE